MNRNYTTWDELIKTIYNKSGILFETGRCHPSHNGLSVNGKLPFSISECEFNYMKDYILKHNLKNGYELATGTGISAIGIGYALEQNGGKLVTIDSYLEDEIQDQPINNVRLGSTNYAMDRNNTMFLSLGLSKIKTYKRFSPACEDVLDDEFNNDIDFVFLDCPKDSSDFIRDISILKDRINKEKFAIFVHDTHCFPEEFKRITKEVFGEEGIFIFDFKNSDGDIVHQKFQLGLVTNIKDNKAKKIHCIGDSHAAVFSGMDEMVPTWPERSKDTTEFFYSYRIGAATAYQLENKISILDDILNKRVDKAVDDVLFCFGEVDIRAHLIKQAELQSAPIEVVVNECVDKYFQVILYYKELGYNMLAWGPIASWHDSKPYIGGPTFGTCLERNNITQLFNDRLRLRCDQYSVGFVSIFPKMIDNNRITIPKYLDDWEGSHIHLTQAAMPLILESFQEKGFL